MPVYRGASSIIHHNTGHSIEAFEKFRGRYAKEKGPPPMDDSLDFFAEVRGVSSPTRPDLRGRVGAVLGIAEPDDKAVAPAYAVLLDGDESLVQFLRDQIEPTGRRRNRADSY
ncbi:hypothetical protein ACE1SV_46960 [Streptomyces sennicomposti]